MSMTEDTAIIQADCVEWLKNQPEPFADLIFADPPFNIGYKYDVYEDRKKYNEYHTWTEEWMRGCRDVLKPTGSFWVAIGDDYAAEVRMIGRDLQLTLRNWVIWHYTFGQNTQRKFSRSHTHLFYFVKDPTRFTFNDKAVRTFSDRQRVYKDRRANREGRVPDDVWSQFPRICGTFDEREGWHPCQMPEMLLARIIRVCSDPGDVVLDPFAGSGTSLVAAKKLSRRCIGVEISKNYVRKVRTRLRNTRPLADIVGERDGTWPREHRQELRALYLEAAVSSERLFKNPNLLQSFAQQFNWRLEQSGVIEGYAVEEIWIQLERLRKAGKLGRVKVHVNEPVGIAIRELNGSLFEGASK